MAARDATLDKFADMWEDSVKLETAMSVCLCLGTEAILGNNYDDAIAFAAYARYFEQYIAVELHQTQALPNWPKIYETHNADLHTLVKFFRHRIPCSCLDKKYEKVKDIPTMAFCWNPNCSIPDKRSERSKAKYCSRCRSATYCSRECQVADWSTHKRHCDKDALMIALFEAKQQNV